MNVSIEKKIELYTPGPPLAPHGSTLTMEPLEPGASRDLRAYARVLRERRWTVLAVPFVLLILVLVATLKEKPVYQATTLLEIEKENPNILTVQDLFELENVSDTYLETQYKVLRSETLARRVIDELGLGRREEFNPPRGFWHRSSAADPADAAERTLKTFEDRLSIDPVKRSRLVEVGFESRDPELAARAVNAIASNYIDQSLEQRWEATQKASQWLSQQLVGLRAKLENSEDELQRYARTNGLLFLENEKGASENIVDDRLRQLQEELTKAQADRYEKESLERLVEAGDYSALPGAVENKLLQDLTLRLSDLETSYAQLATTFSSDYPKVKQLQSEIDETQTTLRRERDRVATRIRNDYEAARRREGLVEQAFLVEQKQANSVAEKSVQYNILKREAETNRQLYDGLLERLKQAGISAGLKASNIRVVDAAVEPRKPVRPNLPLNLSLALVAGLGLGVGAAFLQSHLDNTLKSSEDVERFLHLPALALIPAVESLNGNRRGVYGVYGRREALPAPAPAAGAAAGKAPKWYRIDGLAPAYAALAEAFRSLRTSVLLSSANRAPRSILITSPQPGDGKTTVTINLAISLAQLGQRTLLIDCDLRRPCTHRLFGQREEAGLVSYLTGQQGWREAVRSTGVTGLDALFCGPIPPAPAELLSSQLMVALLQEALEQYQFVVLDSPPVLNVADARILATQVDGVVLVVKGASTPRELAQRARAHAHAGGANVLGVVLNNLDLRADGYGYHYGYGKGREEDGEETEKQQAGGLPLVR